MATAADQRPLVFVGTYTAKDSEGIYSFRMDPETGALEPVGVTPDIQNPSFLAIHPSKRFLYSVEEKGGGMVRAFAIDAETGELTPLNVQSAEGSAPCHLSVEQTGRYLLVANYSSGTAAMLPINPDGSLEPACDVHQHEGSSINTGRQEGPHAHSVTVGPTNRFAYVADLGIDKLVGYRLDLEAGKMIPDETATVSVTPGAGPRHFAFHPSGQFAYVINELNNTIIGFAHDMATGALTELQIVPTLPEGYEEQSHTADIHVSPSGAHLYGSNRGHDSLAVYAIDGRGMLRFVEHELTGGANPRNFAIDPSGRFILAANQDTDSIVTFRIDSHSGRLRPAEQVASVSMPVCVKLLT